MLTHTETAAALKYLHDSGHIRSTEFQAQTWHDILTAAVPDATGTDLHVAVRTYAAESTESWTTSAHIVPYLRRAYWQRVTPPKCDQCDPSRFVTVADGVIHCPTCHPKNARKQLTS